MRVSLPKGFTMPDSKPSVGTWVSRGILAGLFFVTFYLAALGPLFGLYFRGPVAWQDRIEVVISQVYWPVLYGLEEDRLPESVTWPYVAWLEWWGNP
jgi:hypothetical protein